MTAVAELDWRDPKLSSRARVALYLYEVVGAGNSFQMRELREAIPGITQIDRRVRELREAGWVIRTYKDMSSLDPSELFLEKVGDRIWVPGYRMELGRLSLAARRAALDRGRSRCAVCGVAAGEPYPDRAGSVASLVVTQVVPAGQTPGELQVLCALCHAGTTAPIDIEEVKAGIAELSRPERTRLASWVLADRRQWSGEEELWATYRRLPEAGRNEIRVALAEFLGNEL